MEPKITRALLNPSKGPITPLLQQTPTPTWDKNFKQSKQSHNSNKYDQDLPLPSDKESNKTVLSK